MTENNAPTIVEDVATDITEADNALIDKYVEEGLPRIAEIDEVKLARILDLYLSGKTYRQISTMMQIKKVMILYLSRRFNWFQMKQEYIADLEQSIRGRILEAKLVSQDFLMQLLLFWQKKIGKHINDFLVNGNETSAKNIDLKEIDKYLKTVEALHRLSTIPSSTPVAPAVGLNLGEGVTIEKVGNNTVEITPKSKKIGDMLRQYADQERLVEKN